MRALIALAWTMLCAVGLTAATPRAQVLWAQGDFRSAFAEAFEPALQGDREAQFLLGEAYRLGRSVDANPALAQDWYQRAARQGHVGAATELGLSFVRLHQPESALPWLTLAARQEEPRALGTLAALYFNGDGTASDPVRAYALMLRAQAAGLDEAKTRLDTIRATLPPEAQARGEALAHKPWPDPVVTASQTPRALPAQRAVPQSVAPPVRMQVGAFTTSAAADNALAAIARKVPLGSIDHRVVPAANFYRLELMFSDREAARGFAYRLRAAGWRAVIWREDTRP